MRGSSKTTAAWFLARNGGIHFLPMVGHVHMFSILHVPCWMIARGSSFRYLTKLPESLSFHNWSAVCLKLENNGLNQNLQWLSILARATGIGVDCGVGRLCVVHQVCGEIAGGIPKSHQFLHLSCLGLSSHGLTLLAPCVDPAFEDHGGISQLGQAQYWAVRLWGRPGKEHPGTVTNKWHGFPNSI